MGADLVDDLVYSWTKNPPFPEQVSVVLTEVDAPTGLDSRFTTFVENRLYELIRANPSVNVKLAHCSACLSLVSKTTAGQTTISRGIDQPNMLPAGDKVRLGLSLHFEAEGSELVLRSHIYQLSEKRTIEWASTLSTAASSRRLLRESAPLISLEAAREEQRQILMGRDQIEAVTRFTVRNFSMSDDALKGGKLAIAPVIFAEQSFEGILLPRRADRLAITVGGTSIRDSMDGWSFGGHYAHLLSSNEPTLATPDLYAIMGFHYVRLRGPGAIVFSDAQLEEARLLRVASEPTATFVAWRLGFEAHIKYRFGALLFLEYIPNLVESKTIQTKRLLGIPYQDLGIGLVVRW
jgi:hypothetical protein